MTEYLLIIWLLGSRYSGDAPAVADRYPSEQACNAAGLAWRTADRDTWRSRNYQCIPAGKK